MKAGTKGLRDQEISEKVCCVLDCTREATGHDGLCSVCRKDIHLLERAVLRGWRPLYGDGLNERMQFGRQRPNANRWGPRGDAPPDYAAKQSARDAWIKTCITAALFCLAGEGITSFGLGLPFEWGWLFFEMGWAVVVGALWASMCRRAKVGGTK